MPSAQEGPFCKLCKGHSSLFWIDNVQQITYYKCSNCNSVFQSERTYLSSNHEKQRYLNHNNDIEDKRYQDFVSPITDSVISCFNPEINNGLDFGCGTGPVISHILQNNGFEMTMFDPFFYPDESYLQNTYDFIACCEVMEHFYSPRVEFEKLRNLLNPKGKLYCKTSLISNEIQSEAFANWYYKNDPTHVFHYSPKGLEYIKNTYNFSDLIISKKLITFIV